MWYVSPVSNRGGYCLAALVNNDWRDKKLTSLSFVAGDYARNTNYIGDDVTSKDFYKIMGGLPPYLKKYIESLGVVYTVDKFTGHTDPRSPRLRDCITVTFPNPIGETLAKEVHWAINIPRFLAEQPGRYAITKMAYRNAGVRITPFETFLLAHSFRVCYVTRDGDSHAAGLRSEYISDQSMLNGWQVSNDLPTILGRLYDAYDLETLTREVQEDFVYWGKIQHDKKPLKLKPTQEDVDKFRGATSIGSSFLLETDAGERLPIPKVSLVKLKTALRTLRRHLKQLYELGETDGVHP